MQEYYPADEFDKFSVSDLKKLARLVGNEHTVAAVLNGDLKVSVRDKYLSGLIVTMQILVSDSRPIEAAVAGGGYDYSHKGLVAENYPTPRDVNPSMARTVSVYQFKRVRQARIRLISSDEVIENLIEAHCEPASIHDLLALDHAKPDLVKDVSIVALGCPRSVSGFMRVPYLVYEKGKRKLYLRHYNDHWSDKIGFLAVHTIPSGK